MPFVKPPFNLPVDYFLTADFFSLSYSKFMYGLKLAGVELNRKVLADMAVNDAQGFASLVELAKSKLA